MQTNILLYLGLFWQRQGDIEGIVKTFMVQQADGHCPPPQADIAIEPCDLDPKT
jgi:hypothetical protein